MPPKEIAPEDWRPAVSTGTALRLVFPLPRENPGQANRGQANDFATLGYPGLPWAPLNLFYLGRLELVSDRKNGYLTAFFKGVAGEQNIRLRTTACKGQGFKANWIYPPIKKACSRLGSAQALSPSAAPEAWPVNFISRWVLARVLLSIEAGV